MYRCHCEGFIQSCLKPSTLGIFNTITYLMLSLLRMCIHSDNYWNMFFYFQLKCMWHCIADKYASQNRWYLEAHGPLHSFEKQLVPSITITFIENKQKLLFPAWKLNCPLLGQPWCYVLSFIEIGSMVLKKVFKYTCICYFAIIFPWKRTRTIIWINLSFFYWRMLCDKKNWLKLAQWFWRRRF